MTTPQQFDDKPELDSLIEWLVARTPEDEADAKRRDDALEGARLARMLVDAFDEDADVSAMLAILIEKTGKAQAVMSALVAVTSRVEHRIASAIETRDRIKAENPDAFKAVVEAVNAQ